MVKDGYEPDPYARVLATKKANYGPVGGVIAMTWKAGAFHADGTPTGLDKMAISAKAERVFVFLLKLFTEQGRRVNHKGAGTFAPREFAAHAKSEGVTKAGFKQAMEALLERGVIEIAQEGPPSRRVSYLKMRDE